MVRAFVNGTGVLQEYPLAMSKDEYLYLNIICNVFKENFRTFQTGHYL